MRAMAEPDRELGVAERQRPWLPHFKAADPGISAFPASLRRTTPPAADGHGTEASPNPAERNYLAFTHGFTKLRMMLDPVPATIPSGKAVSLKPVLRVLIVEDSEFDAQMMVSLLRKGGYDVICERVETAPAMKSILADRAWDVVLSDYNLPEFNAPEALRILRDSGLDLPFLIVSGGIGE